MVEKNILIISSEFPPQPGGIGKHCFHLASALSDVGYHITVLTDQRDKSIKESNFDESLNFKVIRIKKTEARITMYNERFKKAIQLSKTADCCIVTGKFSIWLGAFLSSFKRKQVIGIVHGTEVNFKSMLLKATINWSLKQFKHVVAVSKFTASLVSHLNLKNLVVIPNGYVPEEWQTENRVTYQLKGYPKLVTVGRVSERKGQLQMIKHLPMVLAHFPDAHYHCIGIDDNKQDCLKLIKQLNLKKHVTFHGILPHKDLEQVYMQSDIAVMLSKNTISGDVEGFGIALLEANHYGIPSLGSKGTGIEEAIKKDVSGILVDSEHSQDVINAICQLIEDREKFKAGSKKWAKDHNWTLLIGSYQNLLAQCD